MSSAGILESPELPAAHRRLGAHRPAPVGFLFYRPFSRWRNGEVSAGPRLVLAARGCYSQRTVNGRSARHGIRAGFDCARLPTCDSSPPPMNASPASARWSRRTSLSLCLLGALAVAAAPLARSAAAFPEAEI